MQTSGGYFISFCKTGMVHYRVNVRIKKKKTGYGCYLEICKMKSVTMFPLHDLLETQLSLAQWTRVTACLPTSSPRGKGHSPSAIGSRGFSDRSEHSPGASADTDRGSGLGQGCKVLSPCPARCSRLRLREHLPWLCMKKKLSDKIIILI